MSHVSLWNPNPQANTLQRCAKLTKVSAVALPNPRMAKTTSYHSKLQRLLQLSPSAPIRHEASHMPCPLTITTATPPTTKAALISPATQPTTSPTQATGHALSVLPLLQLHLPNILQTVLAPSRNTTGVGKHYGFCKGMQTAFRQNSMNWTQR